MPELRALGDHHRLEHSARRDGDRTALGFDRTLVRLLVLLVDDGRTRRDSNIAVPHEAQGHRVEPSLAGVNRCEASSFVFKNAKAPGGR